jgi:UDP-N-acetylmuramate dehydrogenase
VWDEFVRFCSEKGFAGLEPLSGIPGTVGAAPVQNIGAYGMSVCDVIESVEVLDTHTKETTLLTRDQCDFSYRSSMFKTQPNRFIILAVVCKLARRARAPIPRYHDILQCIPFAPFGVSLKKLRKTVLDIRANKGMTCKEDEKQQKSAGSFFQNPVVSQKEYESISQKIDREKQKEHMPWYWQLPDGRVKIAAAFLMEQAGYKKGYQAGGAGLSPYHALAVVNYGAAGARDIILLAREIQHTVFQMYGIFLETEIQCIGFENNPFGKDGVIARR